MHLQLDCQGKSIVLAPGRSYTLGRSPGCDFVVVSDRVSRRQLEIQHDGSNWVITDPGSTNGSFVGGVGIRSQVVSGALDLLVGGKNGIEELEAVPLQGVFGTLTS